MHYKKPFTGFWGSDQPLCLSTGSPSTSVVGRLQLHGTAAGRAYVHRRSPATAAGAALKADLVASLRARMEALRDEAELLQASCFLTLVSCCLCHGLSGPFLLPMHLVDRYPIGCTCALQSPC